MGRWLIIRVSGPEILEDVKTLLADPDAGPGSGKQRLKISSLREKGGSAVREEKKKKRGRVPFFSSIQMKYAMSYLAIVSVVLILLNTYPVLASQDLLFGSKRDSLKSQGCGDGLCPDGAGAAHLGPGGAGHDHAGQQRA